MEKPILRAGIIPDITVIAELKMKGVLFHGPDHYVLQNGEHTDCFFYPFRVRNVVSLPLRLQQQLALEGLREPRQLHVLAVSDTATRMMRTIGSALNWVPRKIYPDLISGKMDLKPKQVSLLQTQPFIIVDDVIRKGEVLRKVVDVCKHHKLTPAGIFCAINGGVSEMDGVPINSLLEYPIQQWPESKCPLCAEGISAPYDPYRFKR